MVDGKLPISVPIIPEDHNLVHFNVLFAHLFNVLSKCQAMGMYEINPSKHLTINALVEGSFPAINATDGKPTPFVGPRTVAYIHALIVDTVTILQSHAPNTRALRNETMVHQELQNMDPVTFQKELGSCLAAYYEGILKMEGARGLPVVVAFKRKFVPVDDTDSGISVTGEPVTPAPDPDAGAEAAAPGAAPVAPPAPAAAEAEAEAPAGGGKKGTKGKGGTR